MFCGFGGSSYFPNAIHCPGKNDVEIGQAREHLYAMNFCRIVHGLGARVGVPFAADFALLSPRHQWINQLRFPRARMADYFRELYAEDADSFRIFPMYSGDALEDDQLRPDSPYRANGIQPTSWPQVKDQYTEEIAAPVSVDCMTEAEAELLAGAILANVKERKKLLDAKT